MDFDTLLSKTISKLGIEASGLPESNVLKFTLNNATVSIEANDEYVFLSSKIMDIPHENKMLIYDFLLKISNLGRLNSYVGLNKDKGSLTCTTKKQLEIVTEEDFIISIGEHIQNVEFLCEAIEKLQGTSSETTEQIDTQHMLRV